MRVVRGCPHLFNLKLMALRRIPKDPFCPAPNLFLLYPFPVFQRPPQMIFGIVNSIHWTPDSHEG
jgi:hypothetical protein